MYDEPIDDVPVDGPAFQLDSAGVYYVVNPDRVYDQVDWQMPNPADYVIFA